MPDNLQWRLFNSHLQWWGRFPTSNTSDILLFKGKSDFSLVDLLGLFWQLCLNLQSSVFRHLDFVWRENNTRISAKTHEFIFLSILCLLYALTSLHVSLLEGRVQHLVAPILLGEVFQGAAIGLHLLIQPTAVDQHWGTALGVPASLTEHLLQLLYGVAALPLADAVLLHTAVAATQRLYVTGG